MKGLVYILTPKTWNLFFWKYSQALFGLRQVEQGFLNFVFTKQLKYLMMIIETRGLYNCCKLLIKIVKYAKKLFKNSNELEYRHEVRGHSVIH